MADTHTNTLAHTETGKETEQHSIQSMRDSTTASNQASAQQFHRLTQHTHIHHNTLDQLNTALF